MTDDQIETKHKLDQIPHLEITRYLPEIPLDKFLTELKQFNDHDFIPYQSGARSEQFRQFMARAWQGISIIDALKNGKNFIDYYTTDRNSDDHDFNISSDGELIFRPTDIYHRVRSMLRYIYSISRYPQRTRLSRMMPHGGNATWHNHAELVKGSSRFTNSKYLEIIVVHIPLVTNEESNMIVANHDPRILGLSGDLRFYSQHYAAGTAWIFNSTNYHNAYNIGKTPRDHILMYVSFKDPILYPYIKKAVDDYDGIMIRSK